MCLILDGQETGQPAAPAAYGTEAIIEDFGTGADGLLTLRVRGARRFHVQRVRVRSDGVQIADVHWCPLETASPVRPEHGLLVTLLEGMLDHVGGEHAKAPRSAFDDASWVGWRLTELLPLPLFRRQQLLQIDDAHERLDHLVSLLPEL